MRRHHARGRRTALLAAVPLLLVGVLAGCSASDSGGSEAASDAAGPVQEAPQAADVTGGGAGAERAAEDVGSSTRQVVTSGEVLLTSEEPRDAADEVVRLVEAADGRVDERYERAATSGQEAGAELLVRVPSDDLTPTLDALEEIGTVESVNLSAEDVTARSTDLDARIRSLQISVARMEDLLSRATTSEDLITAEVALSERQTNLETLQGQRARLAEQVALSTLRVSITEPSEEPEAAEPAPEGFLDGLAVGWESLVSMLRGLVVVLGVLLPWLVLGGLVAFGVVRVTRWVRSRRPAPVPQPYPSGPWVGAPATGAPPAYGARAPQPGPYGGPPVAPPEASPEQSPGAPAAEQPAPDPTPNPPQER
ncbi:DUF4349 domain-containing protein [Cellulomonas cellasea]|uniref:Polyhydroxyalkanoate synthesis regulator phasin n=1 Tax=Cellulomonas cellasea TaxID=43670 RepID=A0A7W4UH05_9CELL|nr:DUF4349 domain-containing protein [Cellulomonas cellasea]MBB2923997.1 polyhydroxyalkanoate synthesis regulator phasin [Cellulomonas cellasea]